MSDGPDLDTDMDERGKGLVKENNTDRGESTDEASETCEQASDASMRREQPPLIRWKSSPIFCDPFTGGNPTKIRTDSSSSGESEYLRPGAFDNHRDTLARIQRRSDPGRTPELEDEDLRLLKTLVMFRHKALMLHRDTLTILHYKQNFSKNLSSRALLRIATNLSSNDYKSMRLTCRQWAANLPRPHRPASQCLPVEVLLNVFTRLLPSGYDAARHTCKS